MKNKVFLVLLLVLVGVSIQRVTTGQKANKITATSGYSAVSNDDDVDKPKAGSKNGGGGDRILCDITFTKDSNAVTIDTAVVDMKYLQGKLVMLGQVEDQGEKECGLLDMNKCLSQSRNQLTKSTYFKTINVANNQVRFSFNFFVGFSKELGLCSIRVAMKTGEDTFEAQEKVMSYFPQEQFNIDAFTNLKSFTKESNAFEGKNTQDALNICAQPLQNNQQMFISNFYQTFEGFLLSQSQSKKFQLKCEKSKKMKEVQFSATSEGLKKVDVFINDKQFTNIKIKGDDKTKVSVTEKKIDAGQKGDNMGTGANVYTFTVYGQSYYNYINNNCYDLDMIHVARSFTKSTFTSNFDNNVQFTFDAVAMAVDTPTGSICAVYAVADGKDSKYYVQNDMLLKFKKESMTYTNAQCGNAMAQFNTLAGRPSEIYNSKDSRFLAGAVINSMVNPDAKIYCKIDISDAVSLQQYKQDMYYRLFYQQAVNEYVDNRPEGDIASVITAQIAAAKNKMKQFKEQESDIPNYNKLPYDFWTRKNVLDTLKSGQTLANNQFLRSKSGLFQVIIQTDNSLVVYMKTNNKGGYQQMWVSSSANNYMGKAEVNMGQNGQMKVVNTFSKTVLYSSTLPAAGTGTGYFMIMQNNGNLAIYDSDNVNIWGTGTQQQANYFSLKTDLIPAYGATGFLHYTGLILRSPNNEYIMYLTSNGNLVIKQNIVATTTTSAKENIIWQTSTTVAAIDRFSVYLSFEDGNLVLYKDSTSKDILWQSNTAGKGGIQFVLSNSGTMKILDNKSNDIWDITMSPVDVWTKDVSEMLKQGDVLKGGQFLRSRNNQYLLIMQKDQNLVLYRKAAKGTQTQIWASNTASKYLATCQMTLSNKGFITVTNDATPNKAVWTSTNTKSGSNYYLIVQNDGNLVVYNSETTPVFASNTADGSLFATKQLLPSVIDGPFTAYWHYIMMSSNKGYMLKLSGSGVLQVIKAGATATDSTSIAFQQSVSGGSSMTLNLQLKSNGQLVLMSDSTTTGWSSPQQKAGQQYSLKLTDDGELQVVDSTGKMVWSPTVYTGNMWSSTTSTVSQGSQLDNGKSLVSNDGLFSAVMMPSNNLVFYYKTNANGGSTEMKTIKPTTSGCAGAGVLKVSSTALEIYDTVNNKQLIQLKVITGTGNYLIMQPDSNCVLYTSAYLASWASNTVQDMFTIKTTVIPSSIIKGQKFYPGQTILRSPDSNSYLKYNWNGYITVYINGQSSKSVSTAEVDFSSNKNQKLIFQQDGNLVLYPQGQQSGASKWSSNTYQKGNTMILQNGGSFIIDDSSNKQVYPPSRFKKSHHKSSLVNRFKHKSNQNKKKKQ